jgi:hypothetical protein
MCGDLYRLINKWTWFDNICIMSLLEELNHLNVLLKLKLNPKVFNFSRMFVWMWHCVTFVIDLGMCWKMLCVKNNYVGMVGPFEGFHVKLMQWILDISEDDDFKFFQQPSKFPRKDKQPWMLVKLTHLNTMVTSYNRHFTKYSKEKMNVKQLIPTLVWKAIYSNIDRPI